MHNALIVSSRFLIMETQVLGRLHLENVIALGLYV